MGNKQHRCRVSGGGVIITGRPKKRCDLKNAKVVLYNLESCLSTMRIQ